ncbi:MAG: hypothetical protein ACI35P_10515 [Bacillus sp. (in: firmicutes)]
MNKFGVLSFLTALVSLIIFLVARGPDAHLPFLAMVFGALSLIGILFAVLSQKLIYLIIGIILNGCVLIGAFLLLLSIGIGEL